MSTWTPLPQLTHPPIEWLGFCYYQPHQAALGVDTGTELPGPSDDQTILTTGFLRMEAGGGIAALDVMFDLDLILHSYCGADEDAAKDVSQRATTELLPVRNQVVACPMHRDGPALSWTIHEASVSQEPHRQTDPMVNLIRYRSMVTWRVVGRAA